MSMWSRRSLRVLAREPIQAAAYVLWPDCARRPDMFQGSSRITIRVLAMSPKGEVEECIAQFVDETSNNRRAHRRESCAYGMTS
jgi:hypothetical protein